MKIFTNNKIKGHYLGGCAVVVANDAEAAAEYCNLFLAEAGLKETTPKDFEEMPHAEGEVRILNDGNYYY